MATAGVCLLEFLPSVKAPGGLQASENSKWQTVSGLGLDLHLLRAEVHWQPFKMSLNQSDVRNTHVDRKINGLM